MWIIGVVSILTDVMQSYRKSQQSISLGQGRRIRRENTLRLHLRRSIAVYIGRSLISVRLVRRLDVAADKDWE